MNEKIYRYIGVTYMSKSNKYPNIKNTQKLSYGLKLSHITSGFLAVLVGYTSSVAIIFQAATAAGADQLIINSWLLSLGLGMGVTCIGLSLYYKMPIITAWSTPGAALLATSLIGIPMSDAIGAFLFSALLITLSGLTGSFERLSRIVSPAIALSAAALNEP